jgi:dihydrolipoamide dehydrogenase
VYNSFGSKVTIVEMMDHLIPGADEEVSRELEKNFKKNGIEVLTSTKFKEVKKKKKNADVNLEKLADKSEVTVTASMVLVAVGRRPVANDAPSSLSY